MPDVCACDIHESGRGLAPCVYHHDLIREHQAMWRALDDMRNGRVHVDDVERKADRTIAGVRFRRL